MLTTFPRMVAHLPLDGHQSSPRLSSTITRTVIHHLKECNPPSSGCSPTIQRTITHYPQDGYQPSPRLSLILPMMVNHHPQDGHQPSPRWPPCIRRMVTHHLHNGQPDLEFDSSAAHLVILKVEKCSSVAGLLIYSSIPLFPCPAVSNLINHSSILFGQSAATY